MSVKTKIAAKGGVKGSRFLPLKRRFCRFCAHKIKTIDYKDIKTLEAFIRERGKIVSVRSTGNCAKHQRMVAKAIKQARFISLLPYTRLL